MDRKTDIAIIGGGSTGTSIAYFLSKEGISNVTLIEKDSQLASGQTSRSTALIRTHYSIPTVAKMALLSYRFFERFDQHLDSFSSGFKKTGMLICASPEFEEGLKKNLSTYSELGIESRIVNPDEVKTLEPELNSKLFSLISYEPQAGYAEPSMTAAAFGKYSQERGVSILLGVSVQSLRKSPNGSYELDTTAGTIEAGKVVIATGVYSKPIFEGLGLKIPSKPVRHPVTIFRRPEKYSGQRPLILDFPSKLYYKPEGEHLFFAGSLEPELDRAEIDPNNYDEDVSFEEISKFSECVSKTIPIMESGGEFQRGYTGVYDMTPDQQPIISEFDEEGFEGLFCLVGLSGHGFKLCPEFGRIMTALVLKRRFTDYDISIFSKNRFKEGELLLSNYSLSTIG